MTKSEIEKAFRVKCEKMKNPYSAGCEFWAAKDSVTDEELGRGATLDDIHKTLSVVKGYEAR